MIKRLLPFVLLVSLASLSLYNSAHANSLSVEEQQKRDDFYEMMSLQDIPAFYDPFSQSYECKTPLSGSLNSTSQDYQQMSNIDKEFTLGTDDSMRAVHLAQRLMSDFSFTAVQAAGIVGNFMHESGGTNLPPNVNEGGKAGPPIFKGGYGWAQWTGARQRTFISYSIQNGFISSQSDNANDAANYAFLVYELQGPEKATVPAVKKALDIAEATRAFERSFERAGVPAIDKRIAFAKQLHDALVSGGGISADNPSNDSSDDGFSVDYSTGCADTSTGIPATSTGGSIFDKVVFPLRISVSGIKNANIFKNGTTNRAGHGYIAFDILAPAGTEVVAMTGGKVTQVIDPRGRALGGGVTIYDSEKDIHVYYTHMDPGIAQGATVSIGQPLGTLLSVRNYPAINADHLHIDAGPGQKRLSCSRTNLNGAACKNRIDIGPDLFNGFNAISNGVSNP